MHKSQTIDFAALPSVVLTAASVNLLASATLGLGVNFASTTPSVWTVTFDGESDRARTVPIAASEPRSSVSSRPQCHRVIQRDRTLIRPGGHALLRGLPLRAESGFRLLPIDWRDLTSAPWAAWKNLPGDGPFVLSGILRPRQPFEYAG